jgi:hypothetical protein
MFRYAKPTQIVLVDDGHVAIDRMYVSSRLACAARSCAHLARPMSRNRGRASRDRGVVPVLDRDRNGRTPGRSCGSPTSTATGSAADIHRHAISGLQLLLSVLA